MTQYAQKHWEKTSILQTWQEWVEFTIDGRRTGHFEDKCKLYKSEEELAKSGTFGTLLNERYYESTLSVNYMNNFDIEGKIAAHNEDIENEKKDAEKRKLKREQELIKIMLEEME